MGKRADGEGTICKRKGGGWVAAVTLGYDVDKEKPIRKYFYGKSQAEVKDKLDKALDRAKQGYISEPGKMLLADWLDIWLNNYAKLSVRPSTWLSYEAQVKRHIKPAIGHVRLNKLQTAHIQQLYNSKLEAGRADKKNGGLTPKSVRYIHTVLRQALEQAKREGHFIINPCDNTRLPKLDKNKDIKYLDVDGVTAFLNAVKGEKYFTLFYLALNTGLRRGELLGLRWQDLDLKAGRLSVRQNLIRIRGGLTFQEPKTELSRRNIDLPKDVIETLKFHQKNQEKQKDDAGEAWENNDLVFCNELGRPLCPRGVTRNFERKIIAYNDKIEKQGKEEGWKDAQIKKAKITEISFHGLRHTYATLALQAGIDVKTIQENLGHHDPGFTLKIYAGATETMKKAAAEKMGALLSSCVNSDY